MILKHVSILVLMLALVPVNASAYYGGALEVASEVHQVCPCDIVTSNEILLEVVNYGTKSDTYFLSVEVPDGWSGFVKPQLTLASGEVIEVDPLWVTPPCGTEPGEYTIEFTAVSGQSGETIEKELVLDVMRCHDVSISGNNYLNACEKGVVTSTLDVTNLGKVSETFELSASKDWVTISPNSVTVGAWDTKTVTVTAKPPSGVSGSQEIAVTAESTLSYAKAVKDLKLDVDKCYSFSASVVPHEDSVCMGKSIQYQVYVDNKGTKSDTYKIITPSWMTAEESVVELGSGKRAIVTLTATPLSLGKKDMEVYVSSESNPTSIVKSDAVLTSVDCRSAAVSFANSERNVCRGESTDFVVKIENTGLTATAYTLESTMGKLSREKLVLGPGEVQNVVLGITSTENDGTYPVTVDVASGDATDRDSATLVVHKCRGATLDVTPGETDACAGDVVTYEVSVENTGELDDSYVLTYPDGEERFSLQSGDSIRMEVDVRVENSLGNRLPFKLESTKGVKVEKRVDLDVTPASRCYAAELTIINGNDTKEKNVSVVIGEGQAIQMKLVNTGLRSDSYTFTVSGPAWAHLSGETVHLSPLQDETVFLYLSPPDNTPRKNFDVTVLADSGRSLSKATLTVTVLEYVVSEERGAQEAGEDAVLTGGLAGMFVAVEPVSIEATLISILAFLTLIVIALRFVIFR